MELSRGQRRALTSICNTFAPGGNGLPSAEELGAIEVVLGLVDANPRAAERAQFGRLLSLWDTRLGGLFLGAGPGRFSALSQERREAALIRLGDSRSLPKRALFQSLKGAAALSYYLAPGPTGHSPVWEAMDYPGPLGTRPDAAPPRLRPQAVSGDLTLDCDVVVVGSGAGGGTAAAVLAGAGLDVVVLERGSYADDADFDGSELGGLSRLYAPGPSATTNGQLSLLSAQTLGGGTVVNYTTCFRTPDRVREEWAGHGAPQFASLEYDRAMDAVWARLSVNGDHGQISSRDAVMERGLKALGWHVGQMPRNVVGCDNGVECGRCGYGCRLGAKQSATKTWLVDAQAAGARILPDVDVRRIMTVAGRRPASRRWQRAATRCASARPRWSAPPARSRRPPCCAVRGCRIRTSASTCDCTRQPRSGPTSMSRYGHGREACRRGTPPSTPILTGRVTASSTRPPRRTRRWRSRSFRGGGRRLTST